MIKLPRIFLSRKRNAMVCRRFIVRSWARVAKADARIRVVNRGVDTKTKRETWVPTGRFSGEGQNKIKS